MIDTNCPCRDIGEDQN